MQVKDVMTTEVITVRPDTAVGEIAARLLARQISGMPVVDAENRVLGIVSEGDLMRRSENETEYPRSWWLRWFASGQESAADYLKGHGLRAEQVMSREVVTVSEDTALSEVARVLEKHHIKRLPVVRDGKLVGIVSRANLLHGLAVQKPPATTVTPDDQALRAQVMTAIQQRGWPSVGSLNVIVNDGVVELWGLAQSAQERQAIELAAERVAGVRRVENNLGSVPPYVWAE